MKRRLTLALVLVALGGVLCSAELAPALFAFGFGVGVPYELPVAWDQSFSYLTSEVFLSRNLDHIEHPIEIPLQILAVQLDLQAMQPLVSDPLIQRNRKAVTGIIVGDLRLRQLVESADQMKRIQQLRRR